MANQGLAVDGESQREVRIDPDELRQQLGDLVGVDLGLVVSGQNTVTRVPVVTRERLRIFLTIGSCLIWLTREQDAVLAAARLDPGLALDLAAEHVGHRQDGLQRIALPSSRRADVGFARLKSERCSR